MGFNVQLTLMLLLIGEFLMDDKPLCGCDILEKLETITPQNFLLFANGRGANAFLKEKLKTHHEGDATAPLQRDDTAQQQQQQQQRDKPEAVLTTNVLQTIHPEGGRLANIIGMAIKSLVWMRGVLSWMLPWRGDEGVVVKEDGKGCEGKPRVGYNTFKCLNNFILFYSEAEESNTEVSVHSFLTDFILNALKGAENCPIKMQNNERESCEVCKKYNDLVKNGGLITLGEFITYVKDHTSLERQEAKWSVTISRDDGEMSKLQLAYI